MVKRNFGKNSIKIIIYILQLNLFIVFQSYGKENLRTGIYWGSIAKIGIDSNLITGSIDNIAAGYEDLSVCQFFFSGIIKGNQFSINCRNFVDNKIVKGQITILSDSSLLLKTFDDPGCAETFASFTDKGIKFSLTSLDSFKQIRIIQSDKAFFYDSPSGVKRKAYLIKGQEAKVYDTKGKWCKVIYGKTKGWINEIDFYPTK